MERLPVATDSKGAKEYLGIGRDRFADLRKRGIIKALGPDWYAYTDLDRAIEVLIAERDKVVELDEERQKIRGKVQRSGNRTPQEFLFHDQPGGRRRQSAEALGAQG